MPAGVGSAPAGWQVITATEAGHVAVTQVFGDRGAAALCNCQRYRLAPRESFGALGREELAFRLRNQLADVPGPGLVGLIDDEPVAWCAVQPRSDYEGLRRAYKVPWQGRDEDPDDDGVWAVTCFATRAGRRRRGHAERLLGVAIGHARRQGARAIEGYPIVTTTVLIEELHVGTLNMFLRSGFAEIGRPTKRRAVVRIDF